MNDLAVVIVSTSEAHWLRPCLSTLFERLGPIDADVVIADNGVVEASELIENEFPTARVIHCENRGFAHANNRAVETCDSRYVLFLNPDTETLEGTFADLVGRLDARPSVGLAGVKQMTSGGRIYPTIRRFPNALRSLGEALAVERWPFRAPWLGERELDLRLYDEDIACDWVSGSFMLVRREALEAAGLMDERFFIYREEPDLCLRIKKAGWEVRHLPFMTILHHFDKQGIDPRREAQSAFAKVQYARKHFSAVHRAANSGALCVRYALRAIGGGRSEKSRQRRVASRHALRTLLGREQPPFGRPPERAIARDS